MLIYCVEVLLRGGLKGFPGGAILNAILQTVPKANCSTGKSTLTCGSFTNRCLKRVPFTGMLRAWSVVAHNELNAEVLWGDTIKTFVSLPQADLICYHRGLI